MRLPCQPVPLLGFAALLLTLGCFRSGENEGCELPADALCCGPSGELDRDPDGCCPAGSAVRIGTCAGPLPVDAGPLPVDGGPLPVDAGSPDAGFLCEPVRADFSCLPGDTFPAGEAFDLPYAFDGCGCCTESECAVDVDPAARTLRLTTTLCPDPCDCAVCATPTGSCRVPALEPGTWTLEANGEPAMRLEARAPEPGFVPPPPTCVDYAQVDECRGDPLDSTPMNVDQVCVGPRFDRTVLELLNRCGSCERESSCAVALEPRLTDDLPPGGDLRVDPRVFFPGCELACPPVCMERTRECTTPELTPGDVYRVFVGDELALTFTAGEGGRVCSTDDGAP